MQSSSPAVDVENGAHRSARESRPFSAVRIAATVLATIASLWALQWGKLFLIPCTIAVCMTFWLMPVVDRLHRLHIPRSIGAAIVLLGLIGGLGFTGYALRDDARGFAENLPVVARHARTIIDDAAHDPNGWIHHLRSAFGDRTSGANRSRSPPPLVDTSTDIQDVVLRGSTTAMAVAANVGIVLFSIYLMLLSGDLFKRKLMVVVSSQVEAGNLSRKRATVEILNEIAQQFQLYLGVLAVTNLAIGVLTWAAFFALGVEHAAVWGAAAAVLHIVPYVGPAVVAIASFLVTALQFDSLSQAAFVASVSVLIFGLIGMLFSTWLASRASSMNAVAIFTGLMFWGWLWGIWGLLLGTPLMMATKVIADRVDCLNWLGTFLGGAPKRERKTQESDTTSADSNVPVAPSTVAVAVTESAAIPVLSEPVFVAAEASAETMEIARDAQRAADLRDADDAEETGERREGKLFDAPPFPA